MLGVGTSIAVIALAPARCATVGCRRSPSASVPWSLWHIAYEFDCADGQLARVARRTSAAGGRLDILCDVAVQIALVTAVSAVAVRYHPGTPTWFVAAFAGCWMINLVTSVLATGDKAQSLVTSQSVPVRMVKLSRDYGVMITLLALGDRVRARAGWSG